jgi:hypothetical protein
MSVQPLIFVSVDFFMKHSVNLTQLEATLLLTYYYNDDDDDDDVAVMHSSEIGMTLAPFNVGSRNLMCR